MKKSFVNKVDESIKKSILKGDEAVINEYLISQGYDVSKVDELADKISKKQNFLLKGIINEQNNDSLLEKASLYFEDAISKNLDKPISYLKSLILNNELQVQYRNLENLTSENIKDIIKDQNLIEILEELDEK